MQKLYTGKFEEMNEKRFRLAEELKSKVYQNNALLAQLDRAPGFEPGGWEFESLRGCHTKENL